MVVERVPRERVELRFGLERWYECGDGNFRSRHLEGACRQSGIRGIFHKDNRFGEGKTEDFEALLADYRAKLADAPEVSNDEDIMPKSYWQSNIDWLTERFPEGKYRDVVGLCKVAEVGEILDEDGSVIGYKEDSIGDQDFSLNPGRYVGVVIEDDGLTQEEFKQRMMAYYDALTKLNIEAHGLENKISSNLKELF